MKNKEWNGKWYTSKLTIEVDIDTQFGPNDAVSMIKNLFGSSCPAISAAKLIDLKTDYELLTPQDCNQFVMSNFPQTIKE